MDTHQRCFSFSLTWSSSLLSLLSALGKNMETIRLCGVKYLLTIYHLHKNINRNKKKIFIFLVYFFPTLMATYWYVKLFFPDTIKYVYFRKKKGFCSLQMKSILKDLEVNSNNVTVSVKSNVYSRVEIN